MTKRWTFLPLLLLLVGCTSIEKSTRISTPIQAVQFNSLSSSYIARPTFVSLEKISDGRSVLCVKVDAYVKNKYSLDGMNELRFSMENVAGYVGAIDKYIEWAAKATERQDAFTKEISRVPTWTSMGNAELRFTFHSGNDKQHFLVVTFAAAGATLDDQSHTYDLQNAKELKRLFTSASTGALRSTDLDKEYR